MSEILPINTLLFLYKGVGINREQNYQMYFDTPQLRQKFFNTKQWKMKKTSYIRENGVIKIDEPFENLRGITYISFINTDFSDREIFCFVESIDYIAPKVTQISFSIDLFQTYFFDFEIQPCMVEREHTDEYFTLNGVNRPVVNTNPETLYYGGEYQTVNSFQLLPHGATMFLVLVLTESGSSLSLSKDDVTSNEGFHDGGVWTGTPSQLDYTIIPFDVANNKYYFNSVEGNLEFANIETLFRAVKKSPDWANKVVNMYYTDSLHVNMNISTNKVVSLDNTSNSRLGVFKIRETNLVCFRVKDGRALTLKPLTINNIYEFLPKYAFSKLLTYPYSMIRLSDMKGNVLEVKLEYLTDGKLEIGVMGSVGNNNKTVYTVNNSLVNTITDITPLTMNQSFIDNSLNDLPISVSNMSVMLQSSKNQLQASMDNANATYEGARKQAQISKSGNEQLMASNTDQANAQWDIVAQKQMDIALRNADYQGTITGFGMGSAMGGGIGGSLGGMVGGALGGPVGASVGGGLLSNYYSIAGASIGMDIVSGMARDNAYQNTNAQVNMNDQLNKSNTNYNNQRMEINNNMSNQMMLTSASVTHENAIRSIMSGISDASNIAPSLKRMGGNNMFDLANFVRGVFVEFRTITPEYSAKMMNYFKTYGYSVNVIKKPELNTRRDWNYVKTVNSSVKGDMPYIAKLTIQTMFDKGLTLFHGDWVGDLSLINPQRTIKKFSKNREDYVVEQFDVNKAKVRTQNINEHKIINMDYERNKEVSETDE